MGRIAAGSLNQRITLLTPGVAVSDGRGGYKAAGPDLSTLLWARVRPLRVGEKLALGQVANSEAYEITIRRTPSVARTAKQRVLWKGVTLSVQGVVPDEFNEYYLLTCFSSGK